MIYHYLQIGEGSGGSLTLISGLTAGIEPVIVEAELIEIELEATAVIDELTAVAAVPTLEASIESIEVLI